MDLSGAPIEVISVGPVADPEDRKGFVFVSRHRKRARQQDDVAEIERAVAEVRALFADVLHHLALQVEEGAYGSGGAQDNGLLPSECPPMQAQARQRRVASGSDI